MKSFLRLSFLGAVLLVVLGLQNEQKRDTDTAAYDIVTEHVPLIADLPSCEPQPKAPVLSPVPGTTSGKPESHWCKQEKDLARKLDLRMQLASKIVHDISPDLMLMKGKFIHGLYHREIPS